MSWMSQAFGGGGSYSNPADAAMPYLEQVPGYVDQYYNPYINMGQTDPAKVKQLKLTPAQIAKRTEIWNYANPDKASKSSDGAKPLTSADAAKFKELAKGDRALAEKLAREQGFTF